MPMDKKRYGSEAADMSRTLAIALARRANLDEAIDQFQHCLRLYQSIGTKDFLIDVAVAHSEFGKCLLQAREFEQAHTHVKEAVRIFRDLGDAGYCRAGGNAMNTAAMLMSAQGRHDDAFELYKLALEIFESLRAAGKTSIQCDIARVQGNMARALLVAGRHDEARDILANSLSLDVIGKQYHQHRLSNAINLLAFGKSFLEIQRHDHAKPILRTALAELDELRHTHSHEVRDIQAYTFWYLGLVELKEKQFDTAISHFNATFDIYSELLREGKNQYAVDMVRCANELATKLLDVIARQPRGIATWSTWLARKIVARAKRRHTPEQAPNGSVTVTVTFKPGLETWAYLRTQQQAEYAETVSAEQAHRGMQQILHRLAAFPVIHTDEGRLAALSRTATTLSQAWSVTPLQQQVLAVCPGWLEQVAELLSFGQPAYLDDNFEERIRPMLRSVLRILLEAQDAEQVANWHLRTHGLRAQRQVLAAGAHTDPDLAALNALYDKIEALDREIAGQLQALGEKAVITDPLAAAADESIVLRAEWATDTNRTQAFSTKQAQRDRLWREEIQPLKRRLQREGKLPDTERLNLPLVGERLHQLRSETITAQPRRVALLMLIPAEEHRLAVVCLQPGSAEGKKDTMPNISLHRFTMTMDETALRNCIGQFTRAALDHQRSVRGHVGIEECDPRCATPSHQAATLALEGLRQQWADAPHVVRPLLQTLHAQAVDEVHIVPGGDLHLAPWAASLDQELPGLRVRQFPTVASWWRVMGEAVASVDQPGASPSIRWASLACDAAQSDKPLIWVGAEARMLNQIWRDTSMAGLQMLPLEKPIWPPPGQQAPAVHAVAGIGHGDAPEGNWALAGLVIGVEQDAEPRQQKYRFFTGMDLHKIRHALYLVLSCCVLGRVRDSQGEPIGMPALAFGFKARFAAGALVPIPDFEGALFSMALHYAWAHAEKAAMARGEALDWSAVFHATRRQVLQGQWPAGFGTWLQTHLLTLATEQGDAFDDERYFALLENTDTHDPASAIAQIARAPSPTVQDTAAMFQCLG